MTPKAKASPTLRIEYMRLTDIPQADRNPKQHDTAAIGKSIGRFGFADAPILDERTGRLIAGHGRLADLTARRDEGKEPPQGVVVAEDGEWQMPVQRGWASRSDEDAEAFLVAHNRTTELGGWDNGELLQLLQDVQDADPDLLDATGYTNDDLDRLLNYAQAEDDADNFPGDEPGSIDFAGDTVEMVVVVRPGDEPKLYAALQDEDWVVDVRDRRK